MKLGKLQEKNKKGEKSVPANRFGKKKKVVIGAAILIIFALCFTGFTMTVQSSKELAGKVTMTAGRDEDLIYASLTSVVGNDIVCTMTDSGETRNYQIPVGTEVVTRLGTATTFSRLSEGNTVAILLKKDTDIVKKVWITE